MPQNNKEDQTELHQKMFYIELWNKSGKDVARLTIERYMNKHDGENGQNDERNKVFGWLWKLSIENHHSISRDGN